MPKTRRTRTYRPATREEHCKINFTGYRLTELFDQSEIEDFIAAANRRIIGEFHYALERNPRYKYGSDRRTTRRTDNYIVGVSSKLGDLAQYVNQNTRSRFIRPSLLPAELTELKRKQVEMILQQAQYDVLLLAAQAMVDQRNIWFEEGVGIWQTTQSCVDTYLEYKRAAKAQVKVDDRCFHGRVRSQSSNRGVPAGVSVSFS
ncbi:hypothetical protein H7142_03785 [Candidatus Saccharibacteria bacterium]|nr:hypothetical protein [Candidatus Saccharibacteria bacterium]